MGLIIKEYNVTGTRRSDTVRVLYDTGAGFSFTRRDIAENLGEIVDTPYSLRFMMADGREGLAVNQRINLVVDIDGTTIEHSFYVADDLAEEIIIGADMMQTWKISLDLDQEEVAIDPRILYLNRRI